MGYALKVGFCRGLYQSPLGLGAVIFALEDRIPFGLQWLRLTDRQELPFKQAGASQVLLTGFVGLKGVPHAEVFVVLVEE